MARKPLSVQIMVLLLFAFCLRAEARVVRFVVDRTRIFAEGISFGTVGPYQRLDGTAYMEVDPADPLNATLVNLDRAPRNQRGMVEFSAPFFILKPLDIPWWMRVGRETWRPVITACSQTCRSPPSPTEARSWRQYVSSIRIEPSPRQAPSL